MRCVLGFDGGGTKTDCVLMGEAGTVLARALAGPSNPSRIGTDAALGALLDAADQALASAGKSAADVVAIHGAIAGAGAAQAIPELARRLKLRFANSAIFLDTDLNVTLAATREIPSIAVIAGTGSAVLGRTSPDALAREGGLGPILGDPGSAYDIGRQAVALALRQWQAGENSGLGDEILRSFQATWTELRERIRTNADSVLPMVFPIVAERANQGDQAACALLRSAAAELAELVAHVIKSLSLEEREFFLAKTGGVFGRSFCFDDTFGAAVRKLAAKARIGALPQTLAEFAASSALATLNKPARKAGS
jgi:N-acetylglucosamine kinase-like BadF-type ATPase